MAQHDNYDRDVLKALQKIAKHLESIDRRMSNAVSLEKTESTRNKDNKI